MARLCQVLPIKHVAAFFGLGWDAVKAIDKRHLMDTLGAIDLSGVSILAMDEFAIHKGHRYATVIIDPTIKKVLWVGRGRGREDIRPFFELLGSAGRDRIKAVAMDMNGAYEAEVRAQCPDAEIVFEPISPAIWLNGSRTTVWITFGAHRITRKPRARSSAGIKR